jgi:hypothetical protein
MLPQASVIGDMKVFLQTFHPPFKTVVVSPLNLSLH